MAQRGPDTWSQDTVLRCQAFLFSMTFPSFDAFRVFSPGTCDNDSALISKCWHPDVTELLRQIKSSEAVMCSRALGINQCFRPWTSTLPRAQRVRTWCSLAMWKEMDRSSTLKYQMSTLLCNRLNTLNEKQAKTRTEVVWTFPSFYVVVT